MKRQTHPELLLRCPVQRCTDGEMGLPSGEGPPALPRVISSFPQTHPRTQVNLGRVHEVAVFFQPTIQVLGSPGCQPCAAPSLPRGAHSLRGVVSRLGGCPASGGADEGQGALFGRPSRDGACGGVEAGDVAKALQVEALSGRSGGRVRKGTGGGGGESRGQAGLGWTSCWRAAGWGPERDTLGGGPREDSGEGGSHRQGKGPPAHCTSGKTKTGRGRTSWRSGGSPGAPWESGDPF